MRCGILFTDIDAELKYVVIDDFEKECRELDKFKKEQEIW